MKKVEEDLKKLLKLLNQAYLLGLDNLEDFYDKLFFEE